ncbi:MAG: FAD-dependent oxidoreductase [Pseudomonadales bacterium]|nr:FAD-dependent oxidoreductase [Pseudomonadales bacterium]
MAMDFLIVGAGINGLLLARELANAEPGAEILLLERGECCREASWAGGGIVSPLYPWRYGAPVTALASWAQAFYPQLAMELLEHTGVDPELEQTGLLMLDAEDESQALAWAALNQRSMKKVRPEFFHRQEPGLAIGFTSGLWMPDIANVRNPRLGLALLADLRSRSNVTVREHSPVSEFETAEGQVTGVVARSEGREERFRAGQVILCSGAWSGELAATLNLNLSVEPVKGQMLLYRFPRAPVNGIVLTGGRYLIPRRDGHLLVGSTLEYQGFDKSPTPEANLSLRESAGAMLPLLRSAEPVRQWAGLRPSAPNGVPYIGKLTGYDNFYVNAGQFRNGLVLAPASARLLADILLGREPIIDPTPYQPVPAG